LLRDHCLRFVITLPVLSLQSILQSHPTLLLLDASSANVHGGWISRNATADWVKVEAEASSGVFAALRELDKSPNEASAFIFCEGPGSILGIRTVATAIRTWTALSSRPVYSYRSLELTALCSAQRGQTVICDARRQSWHAVSVSDEGSLGPITRIPTAELPDSELLTPAGFRQWSASPPRTLSSVPYDPPRLATDLRESPILRETSAPDAFLHEDPSYAKWTPAIHRAPKPTS
jgi:tRNA threonylcarbamoyladenosine biosynthesis protein TsaB